MSFPKGRRLEEQISDGLSWETETHFPRVLRNAVCLLRQSSLVSIQPELSPDCCLGGLGPDLCTLSK